MAGRTGKLTRAELNRRGPRLWLLQALTVDSEIPGFFITRDDEYRRAIKLGYGFRAIAASYSLAYLLRVGRVMVKLQ